MKFKKGDRVRCIKGYNNNYIPKQGELYTISCVGQQEGIKYVGIGYETESEWLASRFELVEPSYTWTSKFNLGDKVQINWSCQNFYIIKEILINNIGQNMYHFENSIYVANESKIRLYEEPQVKEVTMKDVEEKYGCKVKIVK